MLKNAGTDTGHLCKLEIEPQIKREEHEREIAASRCLRWCSKHLSWLMFYFLFLILSSSCQLAYWAWLGLAEHSKKLESAFYV